MSTISGTLKASPINNYCKGGFLELSHPTVGDPVKWIEPVPFLSPLSSASLRQILPRSQHTQHFRAKKKVYSFYRIFHATLDDSAPENTFTIDFLGGRNGKVDMEFLPKTSWMVTFYDKFNERNNCF